MKVVCILGLLFLRLVGPSAISAQTAPVAKSRVLDSTMFLIFNDVSAGPYFTAGVSRMNEHIEPGWFSQAKPAYMFGGAAMLSINDWIGLSLGLVYDARELYLATTADSIVLDMGVAYVDIQPSIRIFWFLFGLSFNIPMSANATELVQHDYHLQTGNVYNQNRSPDTRDLASFTELRGALQVPLYRSDAGQLSLVVSGSYPLSKVVQSTASFDSTGYFSSIGKGPLPTVQAGFSYQFDLLH